MMSVDPISNRTSASFSATAVAEAISNIYLVLEPWQSSDWANAELAICKVGCFSDIVRAFQFQGRKFATAVDLSVKTSRDGVILAVDSLTFLSAIEDDRSEGDAMSYFRGLLGIARDSFDKASKCERDFSEIYTGIIGVSNAVPIAMQAVKERRERVDKDARFRESVAEHCYLGREAVKDVRRVEGFLSWASPVSQGLQIALPILQGVMHYAENANRKKFEGRQQSLKALFNAIERLQTLDKDLFSVSCCLRTLVTWWSNTKDQLEEITNNLKHHGVSFYRNDTIRNAVRNSWNHIKMEYSRYRDEVSKVQDTYIHDMKPLEDVDVGRKGALLTFQGDIQTFYEGLTYLKYVTATKVDDRTKVQLALSSIEVGFISRMKIIDSSLEHLLCFIKTIDPIRRCRELDPVISRFFALLLTQDDDYAQSCARELDNIRRLITSDYSGAKAFLSSMKMRFKNPTVKARASETISEMEIKNMEISEFCVNLFANGSWHMDEGLEERLLETRQKCTWFKDKLEHAAVREGFRMATTTTSALHN